MDGRAEREPGGASVSRARRRRREPGDLFVPRPGGAAESVGSLLGSRRPLVAALTIWVAAFIVLGAAIVGLGLLLTHVLLDAGLGAVDTDVVRWLAGERTPALNALTRAGSDLGSTGVVLGVSIVVGVALVIGRLWRQFGFLLFALTLEFSLFLLTVTVVDRQRPGVTQLDGAPPTSSFPSGHTAASVTLYVGLAIVTSSLIRSRLASTLVWALAVALPMLVAASRLYRGMHFPSDVVAGALLASATLLLALFAVRCTVAAGERRRQATERERPAADTPHGNPPQEVPS